MPICLTKVIRSKWLINCNCISEDSRPCHCHAIGLLQLLPMHDIAAMNPVVSLCSRYRSRYTVSSCSDCSHLVQHWIHRRAILMLRISAVEIDLNVTHWDEFTEFLIFVQLQILGDYCSPLHSTGCWKSWVRYSECIGKVATIALLARPAVY